MKIAKPVTVELGRVVNEGRGMQWHIITFNNGAHWEVMAVNVKHALDQASCIDVEPSGNMVVLNGDLVPKNSFHPGGCPRIETWWNNVS